MSRRASGPAASRAAAPPRSARAVALEILRRVEVDTAFPDPLLDRLPVRARLDARDRGLVTELVYGTLRWQRLIDWHLARVAHRPTAALAPWVRALLRSSIYQLAFLDRIPARAVVHEAVELAKGRRPAAAAAFVNAVLRALADTPRPWPEPTVATGELDARATRVSQPTWLLARWSARYGEADALALAAAMNARPPLVLRVNTLETTAEALACALRDGGAVVTPSALAPEALRVSGAGDPRALAPLRDGACAVQDEGAILVGRALDPQPGETVADVCAAPGTKTTHLAALMENRGRVVATDRHAGRLARVTAAARRMGATIVEVRPGGAETLAAALGPVCDRVLVDAPCSNLGVLRRNPDAKWRRQPADLPAMVAAQAAVLDAGAALVRPGGVLLYVTCSLEPEENEDVVAAFRARHPGFRPDPLPDAVPETCRAAPGMLRTYPHRHGTDGFTAFRLRRSA
jgi:16S rRNA (cytosine967-C5)-methyltransferase